MDWNIRVVEPSVVCNIRARWHWRPSENDMVKVKTFTALPQHFHNLTQSYIILHTLHQFDFLTGVSVWQDGLRDLRLVWLVDRYCDWLISRAAAQWVAWMPQVTRKRHDLFYKSSQSLNTDVHWRVRTDCACARSQTVNHSSHMHTWCTWCNHLEPRNPIDTPSARVRWRRWHGVQPRL